MTKDDATWLKIAYIALALISAYILSKFFDTLGAQTGWSESYANWYPAVGTGLSLVLGLGFVFWLGRDKERNNYFMAAINEVRKVVWPSTDDTRRMTIIVCVFVAFFGVIIACIDYICGFLIRSLFA